MSSALSLLYRPTWVEIDTNAIAYNTRRLKQIVGAQVALMAVVKADAYGHGAVTVARTVLANGASQLAVANMEEAVILRDAGVRAPILILGYIEPALVPLVIANDLRLTVYHPALAADYLREARHYGQRLRVHIKIDTGMGRLGILPTSAPDFLRDTLGLPEWDVEGIYTHFSMADENHDYTAEQVRVLRRLVEPLREAGIKPLFVHAANSAGTLASADNHFDLVRVGLALYGLSPSPIIPVPSDFRPALTWKTVIASVKSLPTGHAVGYGNTYVTSGEERIAVLPVGYADGLRRAPGNYGEVLVHGTRAPIVGRVSMEKTMINVSHIPDVQIGDEVVLLGSQGNERIRAEDIAARIGTINYEVVCSVLPRVPRTVQTSIPNK